MATSMAAISRRLYRTLILGTQKQRYCNHLTESLFSTDTSARSDSEAADDEFSALDSDSDAASASPATSVPPSTEPSRRWIVNDYTLEGGIDVGIYKAILVGQVGQVPLQKRLRSGALVTLTTVGTGGIRNERIPFANEEPREYADRCNVQWHRVCVYPNRLAATVMKHAQPGTILYLEGNLETKIFTDPITGLVRRVREVAVRRNGRVVFLGNGDGFDQPNKTELRGVGYF